jgi:hypothetical protein
VSTVVTTGSYTILIFCDPYVFAMYLLTMCAYLFTVKVHGNVSMLVPMTVTAVACSIEAPPICSSTATCSNDHQQELSATQSTANITNIDSSNNSSSTSSSMTSADDNKFVGCLESTFERYWGAKGALHNRQSLAHSVTGVEWHDPSVN